MEKTGIIYPTVDLDGQTYTLKFTRASILYRLSRNGVDIGDLWRPAKAAAGVVDVLHAVISDQLAPGVFPTPEALAEYLLEPGTDRMRTVANALREAVGKVFPPVAPPAPADSKPAVQ